MSNTPFLFIGISFILSIRLSFIVFTRNILLEKHFIRGSTNASS